MRRTRFAPSPTGPLHLGHAYAAMIAFRRADPGEFLLRIEDIDASRCRPAYEQAIYRDLAWLGLYWPSPVLRQSQRQGAYDRALARLADLGLIYPCQCSRADIRAALSAPQEGAPILGPDGLVYPGLCRPNRHHARDLAQAPEDAALRLNMAAAITYLRRAGSWADLQFREGGPGLEGLHTLDEERLVTRVGDVVLSRRGMGISYHLAVVVDDGEQAITEVTRGADLFAATEIHVLLQSLLELPTPSYYHHGLIRDAQGRRLAKRSDAQALSLYRDQGLGPADILVKTGLQGLV